MVILIIELIQRENVNHNYILTSTHNFDRFPRHRFKLMDGEGSLDPPESDEGGHEMQWTSVQGEISFFGGVGLDKVT